MSDVQNLFQREKQQWLEDCRAAARKLLKKRYMITVEDVLKICPRPSYVHRNATGTIFNHSDFYALGWQMSKRPAMHHRFIRQWTLSKK